MNTHNFIEGTDAYRNWAMGNPNASYYEDNIAYEISRSQDFINWEYNNPNGTLSQYLNLLKLAIHGTGIKPLRHI